MVGSKKIIAIVLAGLAAIAPVRLVRALDDEIMTEYSQNSIFLYDPTNCDGTSGSKSYDNLVVGKSNSERLKEVVLEYGELAMDLQREWGTPWEVVFAQMVMESGVGTTGLATAIWETNRYYNWLGMTGSGGDNSVGTPYVSSGRNWAQYATIGDMIKDWAGKYIARNGYYDKAFQDNLDPDSFDLRGFLNDFISVYAPSSDGNDVNNYITIVESYINGTIADVREEKNWPSSAELASGQKKSANLSNPDGRIPIGGKHPIGSSTGESDDGVYVDACVLLRESPDYNSADYQEKLANLHDYNQSLGTFASWDMCTGYDINRHGCGVMSLYAAWYMFSGEGYNDGDVFNKFLAASRSDGYNACYATAARSYGSNLNAFTGMSGGMLFEYNGSYVDHWDEMVEALREGKKLIFYVGSDSGGTSFTNGGHYMMIDHYNEEKQMMYLFDPSMWSGKYQNGAAGNNPIAGAGVELLTDDPRDGIYVNRDVMNNKVRPAHALAVAYDGCYGGGVNVCRSTADGLTNGGMTQEQAESFIRPYAVEAEKRKFGSYGSGYANGTVIGDGWVADAGCVGGTLNNCVAMSQWFINNYTNLGPSIGTTNGWNYTDMLIGAGLADGGTVPRAYAIFSTTSYNHTGVVLGVNEEKGEMYTAEASCGMYHGAVVKVVSMDSATSGEYRYAYTDEKLKTEKFKQ